MARLEAQVQAAREREQEYATSVDQFSDVVKKAVDQALAERDNKAVEAATAEKQTQETAATVTETAKVKTATSVDSTGPLYGNRDHKQEFDLRKMTTLKELPTDKVVVALPKYNTDSAGNKIGYDMKNTQIQFFDPQAHEERSKTDDSTGGSTYQLLGMSPVVLHVPERA